jgi:hypothetical protein
MTNHVRRPARLDNSTYIARVSEREWEGQKLASRACLINTIYKLTIRGASEDKSLPAKRLHGRVSGSKGCGNHRNLHQSSYATYPPTATPAVFEVTKCRFGRIALNRKRFFEVPAGFKVRGRFIAALEFPRS